MQSTVFYDLVIFKTNASIPTIFSLPNNKILHMTKAEGLTVNVSLT